MENTVLEIEREIMDLRYQQNKAINIIRTIDLLKMEKEYCQLIMENTKKLAKVDSKMEILEEKIEMYKRLSEDYKYFINSII